MPRKPKLPQAEVSNGRDNFQTPNYATKLLVPFIKNRFIWECANGVDHKIGSVLAMCGMDVYSSNLETGRDFLTCKVPPSVETIITNPPYSLKRKFYKRCMETGLPWALLIPADYSGWIIKALQDGAEKIIPTRRIDFITPNILMNICRGETWEYHYQDVYGDPKDVPDSKLDLKFMFKSVSECPTHLLSKYTSSYYHSMWLTWDFNLGKSETFVELTKEMKEDI